MTSSRRLTNARPNRADTRNPQFTSRNATNAAPRRHIVGAQTAMTHGHGDVQAIGHRNRNITHTVFFPDFLLEKLTEKTEKKNWKKAEEKVGKKGRTRTTKGAAQNAAQATANGSNSKQGKVRQGRSSPKEVARGRAGMQAGRSTANRSGNLTRRTVIIVKDGTYYLPQAGAAGVGSKLLYCLGSQWGSFLP